MKKILIINLRRLGDVFSTAHLINSIMAKEDSQISLLTYKEVSSATENIKNIHHAFHIDRKEIITLMANRLISDSVAFEEFFSQISPIKEEKWDQIINYSNDTVGAYLASYLKESAESITGIHFDKKRNICKKSDWELFFNDVAPIIKYTPVHFIDCYHHMVGVPLSRIGEKLKLNPTHNVTVQSNFDIIKQAYHPSDEQLKIVAIQLRTSDQRKNIPDNILHDLVRLILERKNLIPILLVAPFDEEKAFAQEFNRLHNDELVIVESDLQAAASILASVDLLITPDTAIKHIGDLLNTPMLEVSLGYAPFLKQGSYSENALILTDSLSHRNFTESHEQVDTSITALDILSAASYILSRKSSEKPSLSSGVALYTASFDNMGISYTAIAGSVDTEIEIHRLISRQLIYSILEKNVLSPSIVEIHNLHRPSINVWVDSEMEFITNVVKDILGTLRSLIPLSGSRKNSQEFVTCLERLITHCERESLAQIPILIFKNKLENIDAKTFEENRKEVEFLLYELKADMQKCIQSLKNLESTTGIGKKELTSNRSPEAAKI